MRGKGVWKTGLHQKRIEKRKKMEFVSAEVQGNVNQEQE